MPELPEVELYKRYFARHALKRRIAAVDVRDKRVLGSHATPSKLRSVLAGESFSEVTRRGKHLFADAGSAWLHLHFGMSGDLAFYQSQEGEPRFARLVFDFADGSHLAFEDMRIFGIVDLVSSPDEYARSHRLGPDALDPRFKVGQFVTAVEERRGAIKPLLMSQLVVAGLGNLYTDEVLFQTGIRPLRRSEKLSLQEVRSIFSTMRRVLTTVISRREKGLGIPSAYLFDHREEGEKCPRCGGAIARSTVGGRTTYFCPRHQK